MDQIDYGIDVLQSLMEQLCNKHGVSMQEGLKMAKGQTLTLLKTVAKSAQNDRQSTHVNKQIHGPKAKAHKETTYLQCHDHSWHDQDK